MSLKCWSSLLLLDTACSTTALREDRCDLAVQLWLPFGMANRPTSQETPGESYPCINRWLSEHVTIEFGRCPFSHTSIRVLDEGGVVWDGGGS